MRSHQAFMDAGLIGSPTLWHRFLQLRIILLMMGVTSHSLCGFGRQCAHRPATIVSFARVLCGSILLSTALLLNGCENATPPTPPVKKSTPSPPPVVNATRNETAPPPALPPSQIPHLVILKGASNPIKLATLQQFSAPETAPTSAHSDASLENKAAVDAAPTARQVTAPTQPPAKAKVMAPPLAIATPSTMPPANASNSLQLFVAGAVGLLALILLIRYQLSETARVRRRLESFRRDFDGMVGSFQDYTQELQVATKSAAADYVAAVRKRTLQSISLDDIRKLAPGARMQPLRDFGVSTLLDCQGWNTASFQRLRGIGPDSAARLAAACTALTRSALQQPIAHPLPDQIESTGKNLYARFYQQRLAHEAMLVPRKALNAAIQEFESAWQDIHAGTSFLKWLFASEKNGPLFTALTAGKLLQSRSAAEGDFGLTLADAKQRLANVKDRARVAPPDEIANDVAANPEIYQEAFLQLLGPPPLDERTRRKERNVEAPVDEPITVPRSDEDKPPAFSITQPPKLRIEVNLGPSAVTTRRFTEIATPSECWVPVGQITSIQGFAISGGLIYVGRNLPSVNGQTVEPALIDPHQPINIAAADCHVRMLDYWSNYSHASASARASYLEWLSGGRADPAADVGYVFLFFYGLERRVLADLANDARASDELSAIMEEVHRLRSIYATNRSFDRYSNEFLNYVMAIAQEAAPRKRDDLPPLTRYNVPFALRMKLGQLAAANQPLPARWAYAWHYCDPRTRLLAPAERCPEQYAALFSIKYEQRYSEGLNLPTNRTRLKVTYRPASASFGNTLVRSLDLPDVSVLTSLFTKIDEVAVECFSQLDPYSRFLGRNRDQASSLDARLLLPMELWPAATRTAVQTLTEEIRSSTDVPARPFRELFAMLNFSSAPTRAQFQALTRTLSAYGIGIEPDLRFSKEVPALNDPVALFAQDGTEKMGPQFALATLVLQLGAAVASADGEFAASEAQKLRHEIERLDGLEPADRLRLFARMATYRLRAPSTTGLRSTIEQLNAETRLKITDVLLGIVLADGIVEPREVRMMEKIYNLLGLETASLYARLHGLATTPDATSSVSTTAPGEMQLDRVKIARLMAASDEVAKKLSAIFTEDSAPPDQPKPEPEPVVTQDHAQPLLPDLDLAHAELLVIVLGRAQWTRPEFEEVCADKGLMPDGAIERLNDAAFNRFNEPILEGDDPLEVAQHLFQEITA